MRYTHSLTMVALVPGSEGALLEPGMVVDGRYQVERRLASGGMGDVYRAEHVYMKRKVALKLLRPEWSREATMATRFQREAQLSSQIDHPHIVRVFDFGRLEGGQFFLAMELVEGQSFEALLKRSAPLSVKLTLDLLGQLLSALAEAHRVGIVHRDLKPDNVLLAAGPDDTFHAKVLDFGIARLAEEAAPSGLTQAGLVLGTPEYLSPEQALGDPVDARADLYSLSVIAFRMLTGRLPFVGPQPQQFVSQHASVPAPSLIEVRPELGEEPALIAAIQRGLEKDPANRFASAQEMAVALGVALDASSGPLRLTPEMARSSSSLTGSPTLITASTRTVQLPSRRHRTENLTVVFTDIKDFTARTARQTRGENQQILELHGRLLRPIFRGYGGTIVKTVGDAFLVTFKAPTDALLCGMAVQDRLAEHNREAPETDRFEVRIAVNQGEVRVVRGDIFGDPVNLAARVEGLAQAGEVCFTEAVYLAMNRSEIACETMGTHALKGIDVPVKVYRVLRDPLAALPYGGVALEPLRPRIQREAKTLKLRQATRSALHRAANGVAWLFDTFLDALVEGPGIRRAVALGSLLTIFGGLGVGLAYGIHRHAAPAVHAARLAPARPR